MQTRTREEEVLSLQKQLSRQTPTVAITERIKALKHLRSVILNNLDRIEQALFEDLHKSREESYMSEIGIVLSEISCQLRHLKHWSRKKRVPSSLSLFPSKAYRVPQAYGVVLIVSPWNYPLQLSLLPLVGALAAGNRVLLNPSSQSPATTLLLQELINNNFSADLVYCLGGTIDETNRTIEQKPDYIFFTGSPTTAKLIMSKIADKLIPSTLELGGKSPVIVDEDADLSVSVKRIALGKFINCGQTCIAPDYLFVHSSLKQRFIELFKDFVSKEFGDNPLQSPFYGRIINSRHFDRLSSLIEQDKVIFGGETIREQNYISPTLIDNPAFDSPIMSEEIFGPLLPIFTFDTIDSVLGYLRLQERPLALYYFGSKNKDIINKTTSGGCCINDTIMHIVPHSLPFGGVGGSGCGAYHGKASFDTFTHYKSLLVSHKHIDLPFKYPPYGKHSYSFFRRLMR